MAQHATDHDLLGPDQRRRQRDHEPVHFGHKDRGRKLAEPPCQHLAPVKEDSNVLAVES